MKTSFTEGPITRQLLAMMFASWLAMASNMLLSLVDMFFLSRLNDIDVLAAIGFSSSISLFSASLGIGFSVATSILVSQKLTREGKKQASQLFSAILYLGLFTSAALMLLLLLTMPYALQYLGAENDVFSYAKSYLTLVLSSSPLAVVTMIFAAGLRAGALVKASMWISLLSNIVNIILDPIFIEFLGWGIEGAAWATVIARVVSVLIGLYFFTIKLQWLKPISIPFIQQEWSGIKKLALPALLSNLFNPIGGLIIVAAVSDFGTEAMAGMAVVSSLTPILFSVFFSLSGAAGPMVGQNIGAKKPDRIRKIYQTSLCTILIYTLFIWGLANLFLPILINLFQLNGLALELLAFYCHIQIPLSAGLGIIALSNGIFNNLGKPRWSLWLSASRATVITFSLCYIGSQWFGVYGAVLAPSISFTLYGLIAAYLANHLFKKTYPEYRLL